jgi:hypothetical protein
MKTPDEIKKGLKFCHSVGRVLQPESWCEKVCPYMDEKYGCGQDYLHADALSYIQQLERERDAAVAGIGRSRCDACKHKILDDSMQELSCMANDYDCNSCDEECRCKACNDGSCFEWRGVKEE